MKKNSFVVIALAIGLCSCVPKKKLTSAVSRIKILESDSINMHTQLNDCSSKLSDCNLTVSGLQQEKQSAQKDLQDLSASTQATISSSQMTIAEQAKRLKDLQAMSQAQKEVMNKLKKTVADALVNFKPDELSVAIKDGKLYVSLQEKLLFKSGSDVVDPKGKEALQSVASILNNNPDINVLIEGHTDSIPIHGKFDDNWALSVARATSIVRILTNDYQVDAHRVTASGRGEFYPVSANSSTDGRARNRRTEIILSPNLNELFKLINQ